jgi:glycosyltransferase involved in cell wall biosynthesis
MEIAFIVNTWPACLDCDFEARGLGGAEAALVLLSRELARSGHAVRIFNQARFSGHLNGVWYQNLARINPDEEFELLVLAKFSFAGFERLKAKRKVFWSLDLLKSDWDQSIFPFVDRVVCMSRFHGQFIKQAYRKIDPPPLHIMGLGVPANDYIGDGPLETPRKSLQLIYCSMPDRGLRHLARLFPRIKELVPAAELVITSDFSLWQKPAGNAEYKELFDGMAGVCYPGTVPRDELVRLQKSSRVMAYPCAFPEGFCISALECMAAGAVPVTTRDFALVDTVGEMGVLLDGKPGEPEYDSAFVQETVRLLQDDAHYKRRALQGRDHVLNNRTWAETARNFLRIVH